MQEQALPSHSDAPLNDQEQALFEISERVFEYARQANCSAADISINQLDGAEYSVRNQAPETIERNRDKGLQLRVFMGNQSGRASTTDFSDKAIKSAVKAAASIAKVTESDPCLSLADPSYYPDKFPDLKLHHPLGMTTEALSRYALDTALECEAAALAEDTRISNTEGASFSAHSGVSLMRNSNGFTGFSRGTRYGLSCSVIAGKQEKMQCDYWYDSKRRLDLLESPTLIGKQAAQRALKRSGARKISTRRAPVIFDATIAPGLLRHLVSAITGNAIYKKASFLAAKLDTQLFPKHINIGQAPHQEQGIGSAVYDADGVATQRQNYIDKGYLRRYVLNHYAACKLGLKTTGNAGGVNNLSISHDDLDQAQLIKKMDRGLLVTEMMGFGVNIVTGDYSRGAAGFWVEKGEIQFPVHEITLSGHLEKMFMGISGIANDTNVKGNIQSGSILIDQMTIGGN